MRLLLRQRPFLDRPGRCSACAAELQVENAEELSERGWTVQRDAALCPSCKAEGWELSAESIPYRGRPWDAIPEATVPPPTAAGRGSRRLRRPRPFFDQPGRCSACGNELLVGTAKELAASGWTVQREAALCPDCQAEGWRLSQESIAYRRRAGGAKSVAARPREEAQRVAARISPRMAAAALAALLAVVAAGLLAGASGSDSDVEATSASSGPIEITAPSDWDQRSAGFRGIPAGLSPTLELGPRDQAQAGLVAGEVRAVDRPGDPELVVLGDAVALAYRGRPTLYVVPTDRKNVGIACFARGAGAAPFLEECEGVASSLVIRNGEGISPGDVRDAAASLRRTIAELRPLRARGRTTLRAADTLSGQARAARRLARAYRAAARTLPAASASEQLYPDVIAALREARAAYAALGSAARRNQRSAFYAARRDIGRAEAALQDALSQARRTFGTRRS